jgi:uncharacterized protein
MPQLLICVDRAVSRRMRLQMCFLVVLALALLQCANQASADPQSRSDSVPIPALTGWVNDTAGVLTVSERQRLSSLLADYQREIHHQIAVLTIPNLSNESIETYSLRVASAWGLGYKGLDNGILVTLSMAEHRVRIELGKGMEHYISDPEAKAIIDEDMVPAFEKGSFAEGLELGLRRLMTDARRYVVNPGDWRPK